MQLHFHTCIPYPQARLSLVEFGHNQTSTTGLLNLLFFSSWHDLPQIILWHYPLLQGHKWPLITKDFPWSPFSPGHPTHPQQLVPPRSLKTILCWFPRSHSWNVKMNILNNFYKCYLFAPQEYKFHKDREELILNQTSISLSLFLFLFLSLPFPALPLHTRT